MSLNDWLNQKVPEITGSLTSINKQYIDVDNSIGFDGRDRVIKIIDNFHEVLFPGIYMTRPIDETRVNVVCSNKLRETALDLRDIIEKYYFIIWRTVTLPIARSIAVNKQTKLL